MPKACMKDHVTPPCPFYVLKFDYIKGCLPFRLSFTQTLFLPKEKQGLKVR